MCRAATHARASAGEISAALRRLGCGLTSTQVEELVASIDTDGDGTVNIEEFVAALASAGGSQHRGALTPAQEVRQWNRSY
jgi:Ca2+-binding EF-hand superfamily protein